jgi:hypothetical protein
VPSLSRDVARRFRSLLRRSVVSADPRGVWPPATAEAGHSGLTLAASLRHQRRQGKAVKAAVESLKRLQHLDG